MFSRDVSNHRLTPRTLQQSRFGPYSQLHVEPPKYGIKGWIWAIGVGMGVGCAWWVVVALAAGPQ